MIHWATHLFHPHEPHVPTAPCVGGQNPTAGSSLLAEQGPAEQCEATSSVPAAGPYVENLLRTIGLRYINKANTCTNYATSTLIVAII